MGISYTKRDAHQIDLASKDTAKVFAAGAYSVRIADADSAMARWRGPASVMLEDVVRGNANLEFAEGWKFEPGPKIVLVDESFRILDDVRSGKISDVIAFVGQVEQLEDIDIPYFQRDDLDSIALFVEQWFEDSRPNIELKGLVLTGGFSRRMGSDKALLRYGSKTQVEVGLELLGEVCKNRFVSCRADQFLDGELQYLPRIDDRFVGYGPIGGILSAMETDPAAAWLVIACDLPKLRSDDLRFLVERRDSLRHASFFEDPESGMPEPLCAIYEPTMRSIIFDYLKYGIYCPRKILINEYGRKLKLPNGDALDNANKPEDFVRFKSSATGECHL